MDGYRALCVFQDRYDKRTSASMLRSYLDVVTPYAIKGVKDVVSGIHKWEGKVTALGSRHGENLNGKMKLAILIGMIPKEFQDMVLQNTGMSQKMQYQDTRDYVVSVATQKCSDREARTHGFGKSQHWGRGGS